MKFVLEYKKGKIYNVKKSDGSTSKWDRSTYVLSWLDNDGKTITFWSWTGNDAQNRMTRKLQQIKTSVPDMILEHEVSNNANI